MLPVERAPSVAPNREAGERPSTSAHHAPVVPLDLERGLAEVEAMLRQECASDEPLVERMALDVIEAGGKRLRPRLGLLAFAAAGAPRGVTGFTRDVLAAAAGIELVHTASLVHDDIIDGSPLRRGRPTLHVKYGLPHAIVTGDFLFTRGFGLSAQLDDESIRVTTVAITHLSEGEVLEQRLAGRSHDADAYLRIITKKTAHPLAACAHVGAHLAGASHEEARRFAAYGLDVGLAFQIIDDVLDVEGDPALMGKANGADAKSGLATLPRIVGVEAARAEAKRLADRAVGNLVSVARPSPWRDALVDLATQVVERRA
ncbi:MAG: polyprenyl synthetase family protein [Thermoplasmatota archaeon]